MTPADRLLLLFMVAAALVMLVLPLGGKGRGGSVVVEGAGGFRETMSLMEDAELVVPGPKGETIVVVEAGWVRIDSSPCRYHICMGMGRICASGRSIVCVPNQVVVTVEGGGRATIDAVTR
jgi:hypothetical protein